MKAIGWLSWRTARLEIIVVLAVGVAVAVMALDIAQRLTQVAPTPGPCLDAYFAGDGSAPAGCSLGGFGRLRTEAGRLIGWVPYLPWVLGALLGSQVVAREVDRGTAVLAWSLSGGRLWWLVHRSIVPVLAVILATLLMAVSMGALVTARWPWLDPWKSFYDMGTWGPPLVSTGVVAFALGLAAGAVTGRQVLSLVVSLLLCGAVAAGNGRAIPYGMADEVMVDATGWGGGWQSWLGFRGTDGMIVTEAEVRQEYARMVAGLDPAEHAAWLRKRFAEIYQDEPNEPLEPYARAVWVEDNFDRVQMGLNGDHFPEFVLRQSLVLAGIAVVGATAAAVVVRRRRPS